jgi:hypothetical protein
VEKVKNVTHAPPDKSNFIPNGTAARRAIGREKFDLCRKKLIYWRKKCCRSAKNVAKQIKCAIEKATKNCVRVRDTLKNVKSLDAYQEYDSEGGPMSKEHFHKPKGFRYTEEFIINLEQGVRQQNVAADRVGPLIELIAKQFADKPIHVQCSSATTILRHERLKDMLSLLYESEVLQHAESINARWDLSPQGSKELLAFFVTFTLPRDLETEVEELAQQMDCMVRTANDGQHYRAITYCMPVVHCASKAGALVGRKIKEVMKLAGNIRHKVNSVTSDHGSENGTAIKELWSEEERETISIIYCAAHALNLQLEYGCDSFDDKRKTKKKEKMTNKCLSHLDFVINLLRRYWDKLKVLIKDELKDYPWVGDYLSKPARAVRTRWLSCMLCVRWLLPKIDVISAVIEKNFLKGADGKIGHRWKTALFMLNNQAHIVKWHILLIMHDEYFGPALEQIQSNSGFNAAYMSTWVEEWRDKLTDLGAHAGALADGVDVFEDVFGFDGAIRAALPLCGGDMSAATKYVSEITQGFTQAVSKKLLDDLGFWLTPALEVATLLEAGKGRKHAQKFIRKYPEAPDCIPADVYNLIKQLAQGGDLYLNYPKLAKWLEKIYLGICCHNVDPERAFSIIGAFLRKSPNASVACYSAHTRNTVNQTKVSPDFLKKNRKAAQTCVHQQAKLNDAFAQDLRDRQKEIVKRHGPTTEAEIDAAMETALEEGNVVEDLPRGDTVEGTVLNGQRESSTDAESNKDWGVTAEQMRMRKRMRQIRRESYLDLEARETGQLNQQATDMHMHAEEMHYAEDMHMHADNSDNADNADLYHEAQIKRQCVVHSINMFLQQPGSVTCQSLRQFADGMRTGQSRRGQKPYPAGVLYNYADTSDGNFCPTVLSEYMAAVQSVGLELVQCSQLEQWVTALKDANRAFVFMYRPIPHCTVFLRRGTQLHYLDSMKPGPVAATEALYKHLCSNGPGRLFVETRTDVLDEPAPPEAVVSPPQPPEHRCDGCKQDTENSVQWHSVGHTHEAFLTLCTECESQQTMQQICKQLKQDRGKYTTRSKPSAGQSTQIRGNSARQQQDAEKCAAQILHELIVEGSDGHQYMPKCAACNNKEAQDLMAVQHTTLCLDCYSNYYTYSEECEGTLTEFLSSNGELTCAACKQTDQQCSRETDGGDQELLCPNCVKVWDERLSVPTGYDVCITLKLFCESKGKPTTASRDGNWVKPGDLIAYIRAVEGTAEAGGGVHWDVGRVMTVSDDGSNTKCQNYEEQAEQAEGEQSAFETWHEADGLFEAPVDELIVLTARKDESGTVVVSTTQINQYANELQQRVETAQAQRAKSALLGPSKRTRNSSNR